MQDGPAWPGQSSFWASTAPRLSCNTRYASKTALVSRNVSVSPAFAVMRYCFVRLPARSGAPQSARTIAPVTTVSAATGAGAHGLILNVTASVNGEPIAPGAVILIAPVCVPAASVSADSGSMVEARAGAPPPALATPTH